MKSRITLLTLACAAVFLAGTAVQAQVQNDYRTNGAGNTWGTASHWDIYNGTNWVTATFYPGESGGPTPGDVNILHTMAVDVGDALASLLDVDAALTINTTKLLTVTGTMDVDANITVNGSGALEIVAGGPSDIAQDITLTLSDSGSTLRFLADHTVQGDGAIVGANDAARIEIGYSTGTTPAVFTNSTTIQGRLVIADYASASETGSFLNSGKVEANVNGGVLLITVDNVDDSSGVNRWVTSTANAVLRFTDPSGASIGTFGPMAGEFVLSAGEIELNTALTTDGRLKIAAGLFDVNADVTMGSEGNPLDMTGGSIDVAAAATFTHQ